MDCWAHDGPLKKVHLPSAGLRVSLRSDAIRLCYARRETRLMLLSRRIGPSRYPQAGGYDSCARPPRIWDFFDRSDDGVIQHSA